MMRDDDNPPDTALPVSRGTTPPAGKVVREVFAGIERIGKELVLPVTLPVLCLLAVKWGILKPEEGGFAFVSAVSSAFAGHFALRKGEHTER